ncbi:MAG: DUF1236 domain-containing protein [Alphaproteobacteria bacterium]|nr:MAG: DUF1236 domain-containing protein [Alphaproteobacteria bacterium]
MIFKTCSICGCKFGIAVTGMICSHLIIPDSGGSARGTGLRSSTTSTTTTTTTISPAWRGEIKEYVVKEKRAHIPPPAGFKAAVGAPLPPTVELYSFPPSAPYAKYRYSVIGDETVLVDPTDRKVVEVIR